MGARSIANKYREGKMQSTLERELKGLEIAKMEPICLSRCWVLGIGVCVREPEFSGNQGYTWSWQGFTCACLCWPGCLETNQADGQCELAKTNVIDRLVFL